VVHFLPFSIAGAVGTSSGRGNHSVLTWSLCELAALSRDIFALKASTVSEARALCHRMSVWVSSDFQNIFGEKHTTKLHRLLAHLLDEFLLRGNVHDGDSGINEALHKAVKLAWLRTNHRRSEYTLQLVLAEQVAQLLRDEDIDDGELEEATPRPGTRDRARGNVVEVGVLAEERNLPGLAEVLDCDATADLTVGVGSRLHPHAPRRHDGRRQIVRAAEDFYGAPWWDWIRYVDRQGVERYGRARVVILGTSSVAERVIVVERAVQATPVAGCPFSAYGCERLRWDMPPGADAPRVDAVQLKDVKSVLCVELDWVDWVRRHGLERMPASTPTTSEEYRARRMFVNAFVSA